MNMNTNTDTFIRKITRPFGRVHDLGMDVS